MAPFNSKTVSCLKKDLNTPHFDGSQTSHEAYLRDMPRLLTPGNRPTKGAPGIRDRPYRVPGGSTYTILSWNLGRVPMFYILELDLAFDRLTMARSFLDIYDRIQAAQINHGNLSPFNRHRRGVTARINAALPLFGDAIHRNRKLQHTITWLLDNRIIYALEF